MPEAVKQVFDTVRRARDRGVAFLSERIQKRDFPLK